MKDKVGTSEDFTGNINESGKIESHSIYSYLVAHPSVLIAFISAMIAILSFFINCISYMREIQILRYWKIDINMVAVQNQQIFYSFCFSVAYCIIIIISIILIFNTYMAYKPFTEYNMCRKRIIKIAKKNVRKFSKKMSAKQLKLLNTQNETTAILNQQIKKWREVKKLVKLKAKNIKKDTNKNFHLNLIIAIILIIVSSMFIVCSGIPKLTLKTVIIEIAICTILQFPFYFIIGYCIMRFTIDKKQFQFQNDEKMSYYQKIVFGYKQKLWYAQSPSEKIKKQGFKSFCTNITICSSISCMFVVLILIMLTNIFTYNNPLKDQKEYKIISISNTQYAVVYADTNKLFLEEIAISDKTATINTKKQRVISADKYPYEVVKINKVTADNK